MRAWRRNGIFPTDRVENDLTLYAVWMPAEVTVKFDLDGGKARR